MDVKQAYSIWADQYDTNNNKTRDLEAVAIRSALSNVQFHNCLEIGCGTGKNTEWLMKTGKQVTAVDLSDEMLAKARAKMNASHVHFLQADIKEDWNFSASQYDLVTCSLVLEHIEDLDNVFRKIANVTKSSAFVYVGELHPFKQYTGSKARFDIQGERQIVTCFNHNISDFTDAAKRNGFRIVDISEYFDNNDRTKIPRILTLLFRKSIEG